MTGRLCGTGSRHLGDGAQNSSPTKESLARLEFASAQPRIRSRVGTIARRAAQEGRVSARNASLTVALRKPGDRPLGRSGSRLPVPRRLTDALFHAGEVVTRAVIQHRSRIGKQELSTYRACRIWHRRRHCIVRVHARCQRPSSLYAAGGSRVLPDAFLGVSVDAERRGAGAEHPSGRRRRGCLRAWLP
jgi:hypothetical protein